MGTLGILKEISEVDPRAPVVVKRLTRRKHTFGKGSSHEWRRDEREAYRGKAPDENDHYRGFHKAPPIEHRVTSASTLETSVSPEDIGTNAILEEFGMSLDRRDQAFAFYGKNIIKSASRIAVKYARAHGPKGVRAELPYLFEAIHWLGPDVVSEMVVKRGLKPSDIMTGTAVQQLINYTTPQNVYVRRPLEVIAGNAHIEKGPTLVVGVPYQPAHYLRPRR